MNYIWSKRSRENFLRSSHRSRYLICDGLINPPVNATPLYAIQYASHSAYAVYATTAESLIIFATSSSFYLGTSSELEELVGLWPKKKRVLVSPDPHARLNTMPFLWQQSALDKASQHEKQIYRTLQGFQFRDLEALYTEIIQQCTPGGIRSTFSTDGLRQTVPRPPKPEAGIALGTPLSLSHTSVEILPESSNPPSRQGGRLQRGRRVGLRKGTEARSRNTQSRMDDDDNDIPTQKDTNL